MLATAQPTDKQTEAETEPCWRGAENKIDKPS